MVRVAWLYRNTDDSSLIEGSIEVVVMGEDFTGDVRGLGNTLKRSAIGGVTFDAEDFDAAETVRDFALKYPAINDIELKPEYALIRYGSNFESTISHAFVEYFSKL